MLSAVMPRSWKVFAGQLGLGRVQKALVVLPLDPGRRFVERPLVDAAPGEADGPASLRDGLCSVMPARSASMARASGKSTPSIFMTKLKISPPMSQGQHFQDCRSGLT